MGWLLGEDRGCHEKRVFLVAFLLYELQVLQTVSAFGVVLCKVFVLKVLLWFEVTHTWIAVLC